MPDTAWVAQLAQGFDFQLPNTFPGDVIQPANLLQRVRMAIRQAKSQLQDSAFAVVQIGENLFELFSKQAEAGSVGRVLHALVFNKITDTGVRIFTHGRIQRYRLARHRYETNDPGEG